MAENRVGIGVKTENGRQYIEGVATSWWVDRDEIVIIAKDIAALASVLDVFEMGEYSSQKFKRVQVFNLGPAHGEDSPGSVSSRAQLDGGE